MRRPLQWLGDRLTQRHEAFNKFVRHNGKKKHSDVGAVYGWQCSSSLSLSLSIYLSYLFISPSLSLSDPSPSPFTLATPSLISEPSTFTPNPFTAQAFEKAAQQHVVIAGGHSLWFRAYFRNFLPRQSKHEGKTYKIKVS